ncbi:MAG TPA: phosphotransferase [Microlunatus sp.]
MPDPLVQTSRLGPLTASQLDAALERFGLGSLITAEPASTGNFGQNVFLTTTSGDYVLRGHPLVPGQFAKERYFAEVFHDQCEVPAPWPYLYEPDCGIFGWPYAILGMVSGLQVADEEIYGRLTDTERRQLAASLGETAARISAVRRPGCGRWDADSESVQPFQPNWSTWVVDAIREEADRSLGISASERSWLAGKLDRAARCLPEPAEGCLLHGDFSYFNATADRVDGVLRAAGVYDLSWATFGHQDAQLPRQYAVFLDQDPALATIFLRAALAGRDDLDPLRMELMMISERISIWAWAKQSGRGWWSPDLGFADWLGRYLDAIRFDVEAPVS